MNWKPVLIVIALWLLWDLLVPVFGIGQMFPWELSKRIDAGSPPIMLDVRSPQEFAWFHVPGATNVPFPFEPSALDIDRDAEIVLICMTGHRSPIAGYQLRKAGFTNVWNLTWGTSAYALLGGKVISEE